MSKVVFVIFIIASIVCFESCEEPVRTELTKDEKQLVDSLYAKRVGSIRKIADSICDETYPIIYKNAKDSFYQLYIEEIEAIINGEG